MWIARNEDGWLSLWKIYPRRGNHSWHAEYESMDSYYSMILDEDDPEYKKYNYITWEDEPVEIYTFSREEIYKKISELINEYDDNACPSLDYIKKKICG